MNQQEIDRKLEQASLAFSERMKKYPLDIQVGTCEVMRHILNGCSWSFTTDSNQDMCKTLEQIKDMKDSKVTIIKVKNGYLINMPFDEVYKVLSAEATGLLTVKDLEGASKRRQESRAKCEKLLRKGYNGQLGIFNLNDSDTITVRGTTYPAYAITLLDLLEICVRTGYNLVLGGVRTPDQVHARMHGVIPKLELAPSGNALFIDVVKAK